MTDERLREIARLYWRLFDKYSKPPIAIDRLDRAYRVGFSELASLCPDLHFTDRVELDQFIKSEKPKGKRRNDNDINKDR